MDFHQLKVFQAAARTSSFTAAGHELSLSQSTVSLHIKRMEEELGCHLFLRSKKRVSLSEAGRVLLHFAERTLSEMKNAELAVREFSTSQRGTIRLGVGATTLIYLFPKILADYRRRYPLIEIMVTTATTEVLLQGLIDQTLDLAVVMSPSQALASVQTLPLFDEELVIVMAAGHALARKPILSPHDLEGLSFISHLRGTAMRHVQRMYFDRLHAHPRIAMELENIEAIKSLVRLNMGAALLPRCSVVGSKDIVFKKIRGMPMSRQLLLAVTEWAAHPPATRRLAHRILRALAPGKSVKTSIPIIDKHDVSN